MGETIEATLILLADGERTPLERAEFDRASGHGEGNLSSADGKPVPVGLRTLLPPLKEAPDVSRWGQEAKCQ
jgi:hypothetical protein